MAVSSYRIFFTPTARPIPPVDVHAVADVDAPEVLDAVLAHVTPRWPGARLDIRINTERMTGRVLAGAPPAGRRIAAFSIAPFSADGSPPAAPAPDPRADADEDLAAEHTAGAAR